MGPLKFQFDRARAQGLLVPLRSGAAHNQLPLAFVLAIASRETGIRNILGDGGNGVGVLQIDRRFHAIARDADLHRDRDRLIAYGCDLLAANLRWAQKTWPQLYDQGHLKIAAAAYNAGQLGARKGIEAGNCDARTTGHDYGADVLRKMPRFQELLAGGA